MSGVEIIFGGNSIKLDGPFGSPSKLHEVFDILESFHCRKIDTAALYPDSETLLGQANAAVRFKIDTKTKGGLGGLGFATKENVVSDARSSARKLGSDVDVFFIHAPDARTDIEDTLQGINEVFKNGFFKRFGLSNFSAEEVERIHDICKAKRYPLPEVYEGTYSAVARKQENLLLPTLRRLGISFYAYSPIAGGFLAKTRQEITNGVGRFDSSTAAGRSYHALYGKAVYLEASEQWDRLAKSEGVDKAELAYRWIAHNSALKGELGDAIVIGARSPEQLRETLGWLGKGAVSNGACEQIDQIWKMVESEAPVDHFHK